MNTNCTRCDKPNCPYRAARDAFDSYPRNRAVDGNPEWEAITETMWYASGVCESNKGNWRDRCLAAEAELAKLRERNALLEHAVEILGKLLEVSSLRGDDNLPHPCDDPKLWTSRAIEAWSAANSAYAESQP